MLKKEYQIMGIFAGSPWKKFTFRQVKNLSGKKSESYVYDSLKRFVKQGILVEEKVGNVVLYSLELGSLKTLAYTGFVAEYIAWGKNQVPHGDLERIAAKIPANFFIFIVTGSYVGGTQKKDSDVDVAVICDDSFEPKRIYAELKHDCEMNIPPIHLYVFKKSEFLEMLLDDKANYGKEIAKKNLILFGGQGYYKIISEAVKNGFNG